MLPAAQLAALDAAPAALLLVPAAAFGVALGHYGGWMAPTSGVNTPRMDEYDEFYQPEADYDGVAIPAEGGKRKPSGRCGREANARKCSKWRASHPTKYRERMKLYMRHRRRQQRLRDQSDA